MFFRQLLNDDSACASYLFGCKTRSAFAISDVVSPVARASTVGVYRFWRDMGYVAGGLIAGVASDALGFGGAIALVASLTAASGLWVARDLPATPHPSPLPTEGALDGAATR